jgi:hypothetical protein
MNKKDLKKAATLVNIRYLLRSEDIAFRELPISGGFSKVVFSKTTLTFDSKGKLIIIDD